MKRTTAVCILLLTIRLAAAEPTARQSELFAKVTEHCRLKQYAAALHMAEEALLAAEKTHGGSSAATQYYVDLLAQVCRIVGYWDRGRSLGPEDTREGLYERSASLYRRSAAILAGQYGADHPAVAHALFELAQLYGGKEWDWRKPEAAAGTLKKALAILEKQEKPDEPRLLQALKLLSEVSEQLGRKLEADGYRDRMGVITLRAGAGKALDLEAKRHYLGALEELGAILKCPPAGGLFNAHEAYGNEANAWATRVMSRILKKMPVLPALPEKARKHIVKADEWLNRGELQLAAFEYHDAIRIAPYLPQLYYNASLINARLAFHEVAIDRMRMYLGLMTDAPDTEAAQEKIRQWEILRRQQSGGDKGDKP